jgi:ParB family chromosome partitioning protein
MAVKREKKRALGRGLAALIDDVSISPPSSGKSAEGEFDGSSDIHGTDAHGSADDGSTGNDITYVPIDEIKPNAAQPRKNFSDESLEGLAESIQKHGLIQPVMLKRGKTGYELIAGERRWRAAKKAGLKEIPALVREVSAEENALFALIENVQREDLNPMDEAQAYRSIMDDYGLTQEEVSKSVGKSRPYIANILRLLKLPEKVQEYLSEGLISAGHANAIGSVADDELKLRLADQIIREGLSVREAEMLARKASGKSKRAVKPSGDAGKPTEVMAIEEDLTTLFGTRVTLGKNVNRGTVEIHYYSKDELDGIVEVLMGLKAQSMR